MKENRSLVLSTKIQEYMQSSLLGPLQEVFPHHLLLEQTGKNRRDRIYNTSNTLLTMIVTATQEDKTLENSVQLYYQIHQANKLNIQRAAREAIAREREQDQKQVKVSAGRPKQYKIKLPKSKLQDISMNTAAYTKARKRVELNTIKEVFKDSRSFKGIKLSSYGKWYGREVYLTDGTYFQMQDTPALRAKYGVKTTSSETSTSYPQGLLQGIIHQGSGTVYDFKIGARDQFELALVYDMFERLPPGSLLLADDLYNSYAVFDKLIKLGIDIIVPGKRVRNYQVERQIAKGDEIVIVSRPKTRPKWLAKTTDLSDKLRLRRISYSCKQADSKQEYVLYTTVLDEEIDKAAIITKYTSRWDIEISIREMKTIMGIHIARSKSEEMVFKEIYTAIIAYNLIRKIIAKSIEGLNFPPKEDFIQKFYTLNKNILMDKKGRVYQRWSPGRRGTERINSKTAHT